MWKKKSEELVAWWWWYWRENARRTISEAGMGMIVTCQRVELKYIINVSYVRKKCWKRNNKALKTNIDDVTAEIWVWLPMKYSVIYVACV